ncbi:MULTISPECIES: hypothetical protein [Bacillaceae]|uniref:hypothetical protein n=1 Tax=Bacillaceae TaxID=186817 RepID=UPI001E47C80D|nr:MULTISPECIES: hypothetical protein [Bacillaceae]MCE4047432.1 hypothetical protein [Bacillus sp. Au-Bac7]UPO86217.1 hypothetical protein L8T27_011360 [Niallia sp. Man26]
MQQDWQLIWRFLGIAFYVLFYFACIFIINIGQSSFSIISVPAVLVPILLIWITGLMRRKGKLTLTNSISLLLFTIPPIICLYLLGQNEYKSTFTTDKWLQYETERTYMIDDLLANHPLKGKQEQEIIALLGSNIEMNYFKEDDNIVYHLGMERGLVSIDSEWLVIHLDDNRVADKVEVVTD